MATTYDFSIEVAENKRLMEMCGPLNEHLKQIEQRLGICIYNCGEHFRLHGKSLHILRQGEYVLRTLYAETKNAQAVDRETVHMVLQESAQKYMNTNKELLNNKTDITTSDNPLVYADDDTTTADKSLIIKTSKRIIRPRGKNQHHYIRTIQSNDINFGTGPAGTGKTFLAVACGIQALENNQVQRILLVRPAVEAGEKLGFLPGDLAQKIDPYLRPLYDALYEMLGLERVGKLIERNVIEIAPLAYMRGRTLNHAFIILDESQNTTIEQMKMFLTRIGFGSTAVINGDLTQADLPKGVKSGLSHAISVLSEVKNIGHTHFNSKDVVRHPIVQHIIEAYEKHERSTEEKR